MDTVNHFGFIAAAYAAAVVVVGALVAWVMLDYRAQRRMLADLDRRGVSRRSAPPRAEAPMQQAKERA
jgi:heme exporter protein D